MWVIMKTNKEMIILFFKKSNITIIVNGSVDNHVKIEEIKMSCLSLRKSFAWKTLTKSRNITVNPGYKMVYLLSQILLLKIIFTVLKTYFCSKHKECS